MTHFTKREHAATSAPLRKQVLIGFLSANHDPIYEKLVHQGQKEQRQHFQGPTLNLLEACHDDPELPALTHYYLLHQMRPAHVQKATRLAAAIEQRQGTSLSPQLQVLPTPVAFPHDDPTAHVTIFATLSDVVERICDEQGGPDETDYYIYVTTGTPQIHSIWLLLLATGRIEAEAWQTIPRQGGGSHVTRLHDVGKLFNQELGGQRQARQVMEAQQSPIIRLQQRSHQGDEFHELVGQSQVLQDVLAMARSAARYRGVEILIRGETGTGKELFARALHHYSGRQGAFQAINCGTLPEALIESILFGTVKGVGTQVAERPGLFELAHKGTVFLDEIGDAPLDVQLKLLRVIQERKIRRLGGDKELPVDVFIISATHRDLEQAIQDGAFREDLYGRLSTIELQIPPLRQRAEDIPLLARHFLQQWKEQNQHIRASAPDWFDQLALTEDALHKLARYHWPRNVRELRNQIKRAFIHADARQKSAIDADCIALDDAPSPQADELAIQAQAHLEQLRQAYQRGDDDSKIRVLSSFAGRLKPRRKKTTDGDDSYTSLPAIQGSGPNAWETPFARELLLDYVSWIARVLDVSKINLKDDIQRLPVTGSLDPIEQWEAIRAEYQRPSHEEFVLRELWLEFENKSLLAWLLDEDRNRIRRKLEKLELD